MHSKSFVMYFQSENEANTFLKYLPTFLHFMSIPFRSIVRQRCDLHVEI